jgi:hypothetical protein
MDKALLSASLPGTHLDPATLKPLGRSMHATGFNILVSPRYLVTMVNLAFLLPGYTLPPTYDVKDASWITQGEVDALTLITGIKVAISKSNMIK